MKLAIATACFFAFWAGLYHIAGWLGTLGRSLDATQTDIHDERGNR